MAVETRQITVGTTATLIDDTNAWRYVQVRIPSGLTNEVYLGGPDVTTGDGFRVPNDFTTAPMLLSASDVLYAVATADSTVHVITYR